MKLLRRFTTGINNATFRSHNKHQCFISNTRGLISASSSHHNKQQQEQKEKERSDKEVSKKQKQQHDNVEYPHQHQKSIGDLKRLFYHNFHYHSKGNRSEEHDDRQHQHNHDHHYSYHDQSHDEQTYYYNTSNNPFLRRHTEKSSLLERFLNPNDKEEKEEDNEKKYGRNYDSNNNEDNDDDNFNNEQHENQKSMLSLSLLFLVPLTLSFLSHNMKHKQQQKEGKEKEKIYYKYIEEELTWVAFRDFLVHAKQIDRIVVSYNNETANVILKVGAQGIPTTKYRPSLSQHTTQQTSKKNYNKNEKRTTQLIYKLQLRDNTSDESNKDSHKIKVFEKTLQKLQTDSGYSKKDFIPIQYQQGLGSVGEFMAAVPFLFLYGSDASEDIKVCITAWGPGGCAVEEESSYTPVTLSTGSENTTSPGTEVNLIGWGAVDTEDDEYPLSDVLREGTAEIISNEDCAEAYSDEGWPVTDDMMCAAKNGKDIICYGDGGGPLIIKSSKDLILQQMYKLVLLRGDLQVVL